jgi:formylglycine-generating enzyme required for sulfatase activity
MIVRSRNGDDRSPRRREEIVREVRVTFAFGSVLAVGVSALLATVAHAQDDTRYWRTNMGPSVLTAQQETEKASKRGSDFTECASDCPAMVVVPAGRFTMGSPATEADRLPTEGPQHEVTIAKPFAVGRTEVTFAQWDACVEAGACRRVGDSTWGRGDRPVINVGWSDAVQYAEWLARMTGKPYRLLSEAEWEYAARAGTSNPTFREKYHDQDSSGVQPMAVKSKRPNAWGFYDMFSSGWERVSDSSAELDRQDAVDPQHLPPEDQHPEDRHPGDQGRRHGHFGEGNAQYSIGEVEYIQSDAGPVKSYPGVIRFRVVVQPNER